MKDINIFGIDLGTTNSAIATWDPETGQPRILRNREGDPLTPSVVMFDPGTDDSIVGKQALANITVHPSEVVYSVKRFMGRTFDEFVCKDRENVTYCIEETGHRKVVLRIGEQIMTPSQVSARVLQKLKTDAESLLGGQRIAQAVVTVPAYFNESQRQATKEAGDLAGLRIPRIINEPTAAALAFGLGTEPQTVAVYDLGGGTFDISILRVEHGLFRVKATAGDTHLGGNDFDMIVVNWIKESFEQEHDRQLPVQENTIIRAKLRQEAEKAKITLTSAPEYTVSLPDLYSPDSSGSLGENAFSLDITLTRQKLEELIRPFIQRTLDICDEVLKKAKLKPSDIQQVLLVGGQTRTLAVKAAINNKFGWKINDSVNPDEVVARGAAILGARLCGYLKNEVRLWDVIPLSLGIELSNEKMDVIIEANTPIPIEQWRKGPHAFTTRRDGQERIRFRIFQGQRPIANDNFLIGEVILNLATTRPAGEHRINCMFKVDHDGILHVRAEDADTEGEPVEATFDHIYRLTPDEVEEIKKDAEIHKQEDSITTRILQIKEEAANIRKTAGREKTDDDLMIQLEELESAVQARNVERAEELLAEIR